MNASDKSSGGGMQTVLALDVGKRRTGAAFSNTELGVPLALNTIHHTSVEELIDSVKLIIDEKKVDLIVVGNPLLLSGEVGEQSRFTEEVADKVRELGIEVVLQDERYTSSTEPEVDKDAAAACMMLQTYLDTVS